MAQDRIFLTQETLDDWMEKGRVDIDGDYLVVQPTMHRLLLKTGLYFQVSLTDEDPRELVGKVKDLEQLEAMGGEYSSGSVLIGDDAYEVLEGFVGTPQPRESGLPAGIA